MAKKPEKQKLAGVKFVTPPFRLSFPHLFEPHLAPQAKEPKYSLAMLFPKSFDKSEMDKKLKQAAAEVWGKDSKKWPKISWPWRDGDEKSEYKGYEGHFYCHADSNNPPGVVNRQLEDIINERDIYAGCYCRAEVVAKAIPNVGTDDNGKPRNFVKFYLQHVMFWKDGEKFGSGGDAKGAFSDFTGETDDNGNGEGGSDDEYDIEF